MSSNSLTTVEPGIELLPSEREAAALLARFERISRLLPDPSSSAYAPIRLLLLEMAEVVKKALAESPRGENRERLRGYTQQIWMLRQLLKSLCWR
jgi:hypothetical protein